MSGAGEGDEKWGTFARMMARIKKLMNAAGSARNVDGLAAAPWSLKASTKVGLPGGVQALSLRPSESLGALRQVDWGLASVLDCLDVRSIARLEMTSVALECTARAAASRRAQGSRGNTPLWLHAINLGLDPDALGARYLAATGQRAVVAIAQDPDYCWPLPRGDTSTTFSLKGLSSDSVLSFHSHEHLRLANIRAAKGEAPTLVIEFRCRTRKEYEELKRLAAWKVWHEMQESPARDMSAADMDAALDDEFDALLGSSDSDASDA